MTPERPSARDLHPAGSAWRENVSLDAPGVEEANSVAWPLLIRSRLGEINRRAGDRSSSRWFVLVIALTGLFTVSFTITLLAVSLVTIAGDLNTSEDTLTWVITMPMVAFGVVGPAMGKAGDLWGHKKLYLFGLLGAGVFAAATVFAWGPWSLILFRTLSASCGAALGPASMAMINRLFQGEERVKALGYWSFVSAGAPVLGVVMGGPMVETIGWRSIFAVQAPLCLIGVVIAFFFLPETERGERKRFDVAGAVLLAVGITSLLLATNRGSALGWSHPVVVGGFIVAPLAFWLFVRAERRAPDPLLPLSYLRRRNVVAPIGNQLFANFAYMGGFILTPLLLQNGLGYSTGEVGLLVIFRPLAFSITAPLAAHVTVRAGARFSGITGALIVGGSMLALAAIGLGSSVWWIGFALALSGIGLGISSPAMTATVASAVDMGDLGVAGATQQLVVQVGTVAGIQVMQTVQKSMEDSKGLIESYGVAYYLGAAMCVVAAVCAIFIRREPLDADVST